MLRASFVVVFMLLLFVSFTGRSMASIEMEFSLLVCHMAHPLLGHMVRGAQDDPDQQVREVEDALSISHENGAVIGGNEEMLMGVLAAIMFLVLILLLW